MNTFILCFILATAALAQAYFPETPLSAGLRRRPKVVGGKEAVPHSLPYQVGLLLNGSFCGGSLITKRYVLTAAHCGVVTKYPVVVMGAHKVVEREPQQTLMKAKRVVVHEKYSTVTFKNDIAVIELPEDAPQDKYVQAVKLARPNGELFVGETGQVSGWGRAYDNSTTISPVLRVVQSTILDNDECMKKFGFMIYPSIICLDGSKKMGSCNGDSGGPLTVKTEEGVVQVGVVSYGSSAGCEKGYPTGYSRVTSFYKWVKNNTDYQE